MSGQGPAEKLFSVFEQNAKVHGMLASITFLVVLPVGILVPRYLRTFTNRWWYAHWVINFFIACPLILTAWATGREAHDIVAAGTSLGPHGKRGLVVIGLYSGQLMLGVFIHYVKIPFPSLGHRPPQNFFHALLGLAILVLAQSQTHDGIYNKTRFLSADAIQTAKRAWLILVFAFWSLYTIGLIFLRRQYRQERKATGRKVRKDVENYDLTTRTGSDFHSPNDDLKVSAL